MQGNTKLLLLLLEVIALLADRYKEYDHVTGLQVCNEPSRSCPPSELLAHYIEAVATVREAGARLEALESSPLMPRVRATEEAHCHVSEDVSRLGRTFFMLQVPLRVRGCLLHHRRNPGQGQHPCDAHSAVVD